MNVAAVDVSGSIDSVENYSKIVYDVLKTLDLPLNVIKWDHKVRYQKTYVDFLPKLTFYGEGGTSPNAFIQQLTQFSNPINLYVFTDGAIYKGDVAQCVITLKKNPQININRVKIYYIGDKKAMNLGFTDIFKDIPFEVFINQKSVGSIKPQLNLDHVTYEKFMKDDSVKLFITTQINSGLISHEILKRQVCKLSSRILKEKFENANSIKSFYDSKNVDECVKYVKNHSYNELKAEFQRKISEILRLFHSNVDTYSLNVFDSAPETFELSYEEPLVCEPLQCNILLENCKTSCIPIKACTDDFWFDKKILQNPFSILASPQLVKRMLDLVEPYVMDYNNAYRNIINPDISPFTRNRLKGVYVLNNGTIKVDQLILHNNFVLSTLFQNKLPGKSVLWHMIFLYIMAQNKFSEWKDRLFEEIRFLGKHSHYFVSLNPHLNPPIVEDLNTCFWYMAHVSHKAFPNSKKNVIRMFDVNPEIFLQFYREVYDPHYENPKEVPVWQLWKLLATEEFAIFSILSHYFHCRKLNVKNKENESQNNFQYILFRQKKTEEQLRDPPSEKLSFLTQLDLNTVLSYYNKFRSMKCPTVYNSIVLTEEEKEKSIPLPIDLKESEDKLDHVKIHILTCHPLVVCPDTKKHWKECIGEYDQLKESNLRLFRKYCIKYGKYPESSDHLLLFMNEYFFHSQEEIPELFPISITNILDRVILLFQQVRDHYSCEEYLNRAQKLCSEEKRREIEDRYLYNDPLNIAVKMSKLTI